MAKIALNKLNLNSNTNISKINIGGQEVEVLNYLPIMEKVDVIDLAVQESINGRTCNPIMLDAIFHMNILLSYTNISLTPTQKKSMLETYDLLEKNGVITDILSVIPSEEYKELVEGLQTQVEKTERTLSSIVNVISEITDSISMALDKANISLEDINLKGDNLQEILSIAKDNGAV